MPKTAITLLALLLVHCANAQEEPDPRAALNEKLTIAAESSRGSLIRIRTQRPGLGSDDLITYRGFYVSAEGLAIAPLDAFDSGRFTATNEVDDSPVEVTGIVAANADYGFAVIRTDQTDKPFLVLAKADPVPGSRTSILRAKDHGGTLVAPILVRRKAALPRSHKYRDIMSLGVNLGNHGTIHVPAGTPLFDANGLVAGFLYPPTVMASQRFQFAAPPSALLKEVPRLPGADAAIPLPLPAELKPADPLALDATYLLGRDAQMNGKLVEAERFLRRALAKQPKSAAAWQRLGYVLRDRHRDKEAMEAFQKAAAHGNNLGSFLLNQADQLSLMGNVDDATALLSKACKTAPFDYDLHRALAVAFRAKKDESSAELHLRKATKIAPDALSTWNLLSKCLAAQGKWDAEKEVSDKIYELERLYRPR